jgi:acetyltransferase-like isoleucine patch superfamily enzyme
MLNRFLRKYNMKNSEGRDRSVIFPRIQGSLRLGKNSFASDDAEVRCFRFPKVVQVGKYCSIGKCKICIDANHNPSFASTFPFSELWVSRKAPGNELKKSIPVIENDVWIGDEAIILSGVVIHDGAVVACGAVVTKDVPPFAIVGGNPSRVLKYRFEPDMIERFMAVQWWDLPDRVVTDELAEHIADPKKFLEVAEDHLKNKK